MKRESDVTTAVRMRKHVRLDPVSREPTLEWVRWPPAPPESSEPIAADCAACKAMREAAELRNKR
jgi:hypothetical protein